jgi:hypothetical protein
MYEMAIAGRTLKFSNNASSTLLNAVDASAILVSIQPGDEALFPAIDGITEYFKITIEDPYSQQIEICDVINVSANIMTVVRAVEGSGGFAFPVGATVSNRVTAESLSETWSEITRDLADVSTGLPTNGDVLMFNAVNQLYQPSLPLNPGVTAVATYVYTIATPGQTTVSGPDDNGNVLAIPAGQGFLTTLNGVGLRDTDYTYDQTSLTVNDPMSVDDQLLIQMYLDISQVDFVGVSINILDDISAGFDGIETDFNLTVAAVAPFLTKPEELQIMVDGLLQRPGLDFNLTTPDLLQFTTAPPADAQFFGIQFTPEIASDLTLPAAQITHSVQTDTGTAWSFSANRLSATVLCDNAAAIAVTFEPDVTEDHAIGSYVDLVQYGIGVVTATAGGGVVIRGTAATAAQYDVIRVRKIAADEWLVS